MSVTSVKRQFFSSRLALILTCMGMAVGTGNIWRFPREVAKNGGGSFLIPWIIFLVLWSIPLLMVELSVGKTTRRGPFGAFAQLAGKNMAWMGGFISLCAMLIMCYYAVVTGWTFRYVIYSVQGTLGGITNDQAIALFDGFRSTPVALLFHLIAVGVAVFFVYRGARGIEWLNKILIPLLILILVMGVFKSIQLMGDDAAGLKYLFSAEMSRLSQASHWIAGLTQSAWSTGAGWGLMLAYAVYAREQDDPVTTPVATGLGNNGIEILVALMIFPAIFVIMGAGAVDYLSGTSWKGGIAFQAVPLILNEMTGAAILNILFFFGLASAALTSLVAMVELSVRFFMDFQLSRKTALLATGGLCLVVGIPSSLSDSVFDNQDFVWSVGLILSGMFLAILVLKYGAARFSERFLGKTSPLYRVGFRFAMILVLIEGVVLLGWWLYGADNALKAHCLIQWAVVIGGLIALKSKLFDRMFPSGLEKSEPS